MNIPGHPKVELKGTHPDRTDSERTDHERTARSRRSLKPVKSISFSITISTSYSMSCIRTLSKTILSILPYPIISYPYVHISTYDQFLIYYDTQLPLVSHKKMK